jgi:hypothetical protein
MELNDIDDIHSGVVAFIATILVDDLSSMPTTGGNTRAAVIKDRVKGIRPDFPYIVVDHTVTNKEHNEGWLLHEELNDDGEVEYTNEQRLTFVVQCYGDKAQHILNKLRSYTVSGQLRDIFDELTGATYQWCGGISDMPMFLETDFVEGATMEIELLSRNIFTIPTDLLPFQECLEEVQMEGTYKGGASGDDIVTEIVVNRND